MTLPDSDERTVGELHDYRGGSIEACIDSMHAVALKSEAWVAEDETRCVLTPTFQNLHKLASANGSCETQVSLWGVPRWTRLLTNIDNNQQPKVKWIAA